MYFWNKTLHVSDSSSVNHQDFSLSQNFFIQFVVKKGVSRISSKNFHLDLCQSYFILLSEGHLMVYKYFAKFNMMIRQYYFLS